MNAAQLREDAFEKVGLADGHLCQQIVGRLHLGMWSSTSCMKCRTPEGPVAYLAQAELGRRPK